MARIVAQPKIDLVRAQTLLDAGVPVRQVAVALDVTTQALYLRIKRGDLSRPDRAA